MKWALYNLAFALAFPFLLPGFLLRMLRRGGYAARMGDRVALYPRDIVSRLRGEPGCLRPVWIHAVSVGEVQVAMQLMREWRKAEPDVTFCFSTTSSTGWKIAEKGVTGRDTLIYNPLDFPNFVKSAFATIRPRAVVLTESEIWPVFIRRAEKLGIPLFLVNARVSDRSAPRYAKARWFFKDVFGAFSRIFAQSALDAKRLAAAGADEAKIVVTGSFKFDVASRKPEKEEELSAWIGPRKRLLLGASTWPGEDEALLKILPALPEDVTLVIAPRHFEKADAVEANIRAAGFTAVRRSRGDKSAEGARNVFLADTTGELMGLFGIADAVFVGKSLCEHGSQNMIEPCLCGKPTVVGPYTENFRPVMSDLLAQDAIVQVKDAAGLEATLKKWFSPEGEAETKALGERAAKAVESRKGVVPECLAAIRATLEKNPAVERERHPPRSKMKSAIILALFLALAISLLKHVDWSGKKDWEPELAKAREEFRYKPVSTVLDFLPRLEDPLGTGSAVSKRIDARKMTMAAFKAELEAFPAENAHLWMAGEEDWLLTGSTAPGTNSVPLDAMLELFYDEKEIEPLAAAQCSTLPEFFASYVGDRSSLMEAFDANSPDTLVRPEYFVTRDIPPLDWVDSSGVDADIRDMVLREIRSMQVVRRNVIEGNIIARSGNMDDAISKWAAAILRNPHDTMLLERLHRLAVNAVAFQKVGNVKAAAKCYETMFCVRPSDAAAISEYAKCMRQLGEKKISETAMKRAKFLSERNLTAETENATPSESETAKDANGGE